MNPPLPHTKATDPEERLLELVRRFTILTVAPDIARYRRITIPREGHCIFRGCTEPIAWESLQGGDFLCEGHYRTLLQWTNALRPMSFSKRW